MAGTCIFIPLHIYMVAVHFPGSPGFMLCTLNGRTMHTTPDLKAPWYIAHYAIPFALTIITCQGSNKHGSLGL